MGEIRAVKGMKDLLPEQVGKWRFMEATARRVLEVHGFREIRTPVVEQTELFVRSIGEGTDIVEKEMYSFVDKGGKHLSLRPEATAGVLRAYVEHRMYAEGGVHKLFTIGPMFRRERPQKGRLRQFHQINAEAIGDEGPVVDAEVVLAAVSLIRELGVEGSRLVINSLGCRECRGPFRQALVEFLQAREGQLCADCRRRLGMNPLRVLDCKEPGCQKVVEAAPGVSEYLCGACREHYEGLKGLLGEAGVMFEEDPRLVRGLDYYHRTTFEILAEGLGAQNAVAGGGRYDTLVAELGGPEIGGVGFAVGMERVGLLVEDRPEWTKRPVVFLAAMGAGPRRWAFRVLAGLRARGLWVEMHPQDKGLKAQMRRANKLGVEVVVIVGEAEMDSGQCVVRDMTSGHQEQVALERVAELLWERFKEQVKWAGL